MTGTSLPPIKSSVVLPNFRPVSKMHVRSELVCLQVLMMSSSSGLPASTERLLPWGPIWWNVQAAIGFGGLHTVEIERAVFASEA